MIYYSTAQSRRLILSSLTLPRRRLKLDGVCHRHRVRPVLAVTGVVGDAAPAAGRRAQHEQQQGEDDGDEQPQEVERRLVVFLAAAQLAHAILALLQSSVGWMGMVKEAREGGRERGQLRAVWNFFLFGFVAVWG